jgi:hypothetical protein
MIKLKLGWWRRLKDKFSQIAREEKLKAIPQKYLRLICLVL